MVITIGGVDKSSLVLINSVQITDELNTRNTASFALWDSAGTYRPLVGQVITITEGALTIFGGTIDEIRETREITAYGTSLLQYDIRCVDYNQMLDRFLIPKAYTDQTLSFIVNDIITTFLSGEGITTTFVETGPTITAVFNYLTATQCFNEIAEATGYSWYIDYSKVLHFFARETNVCPFSLTDTSSNYRNVTITRSREQYRNKQYVRGGQGITSQLRKTFAGNNVDTVFNTDYKIYSEPTIYLNSTLSAAYTVGIREVETGQNWYWQKGATEISSTSITLTSTQTLLVDYFGMYPLIMVSVVNQEELISRSTVEGGSGLYEALEYDENIDSTDLAIQKGTGLLRKFGSIPQTIEFETDSRLVSSLPQAGQLISITITAHGLNNQYLIDNVDISEDTGGQYVKYRIRCLDGERLGGWVEFFQKLAAVGRRFVIRENEVIVNLRSLNDNVVCSDTLTATSNSPETRFGFAQFGFAEFG